MRIPIVDADESPEANAIVTIEHLVAESSDRGGTSGYICGPTNCEYGGVNGNGVEHREVPHQLCPEPLPSLLCRRTAATAQPNSAIDNVEQVVSDGVAYWKRGADA